MTVSEKTLTIQDSNLVLGLQLLSCLELDINMDRYSLSDSLARLVERGTSNAKVPGSNPGWYGQCFFP